MFWPIFISAVSFWGLALAGALYLGRRYVRAIEARGATDGRIADLRRRVDALEAVLGRAPLLPPELPGPRSTGAPALPPGGQEWASALQGTQQGLQRREFPGTQPDKPE